MTHFSDIDNAYRKVTARANMLYEFVILYHNYIYSQHTYEAENCNMIEIHTLTYIDDCPGITATQLSKIWHKSKSAISQTVKKLIEAGYVEKRYMENNEKTARLYVTEKGKRLSSVHKAYDVADITQTTAYLVEQCSEADLDAFYRIIEQYTKLLKPE
ncbi:MarR family winged helix-turn-helix transcriptional regulator [Lacrimispora sp. 210928-DFI.3.58]|uniref:MarR family winged helix-turn-helix transcriptional regulator n=1 Tax=Lacrimispora sp. 210928-DFI.3.58 TaxID=2883214 RepID=UPI0015B5B2D2|nr:MarR family winged helix-turn-helix transcriptional regulator [Lacrimispora sp. 210928-DFI.3.58]MCB7321263.1 MarR family winged helix-turn-helix transcriptional regulator [Lacrimispora sp. 210928-DFI.3.58]